jgi:hypothetical protein
VTEENKELKNLENHVYSMIAERIGDCIPYSPRDFEFSVTISGQDGKTSLDVNFKPKTEAGAAILPILKESVDSMLKQQPGFMQKG